MYWIPQILKELFQTMLDVLNLRKLKALQAFIHADIFHQDARVKMLIWGLRNHFSRFLVAFFYIHTLGTDTPSGIRKSTVICKDFMTVRTEDGPPVTLRRQFARWYIYYSVLYQCLSAQGESSPPCDGRIVFRANELITSASMCPSPKRHSKTTRHYTVFA